MAESRHDHRWLILVHRCLRGLRIYRVAGVATAAAGRRGRFFGIRYTSCRARRRRARISTGFARRSSRPGAEVSVFEASTVDGYTDAELVSAVSGRTERGLSDTGSRNARRAVDFTFARTRQEAPGDGIASFDAFGNGLPPSRHATISTPRVAPMLNKHSRKWNARTATPERSARQPLLTPDQFKKRTWVTRPRPGIDRMASAWLIQAVHRARRTFFLCVSTSADAERAGAVRHAGC
jgi:hypothetical protein